MRQTIASPLFLKWVLAHTFSVALVSAINFSIAYESSLGYDELLLLLPGIISGLCIGGAEVWLLRFLRRKEAICWVFSMAIVVPLGILIGGILSFILFPFAVSISPALDLFTSSGGLGFGIGAIVGVTQWFFLRKVFRHAWMWIVAVTVGRIIGWSIGMTLGLPLYDGDLASLILAMGIGGAMGGTLYGLITGLCLEWFVANCQRENNKILEHQEMRSDTIRS